MGDLDSVGAELWTTSLGLLACGSAAARTPSRARVFDITQSLLVDGTHIRPAAGDFALACAAYGTGEAATAGIADHDTRAAMARLGFTEAFTNDRHCEAAGFQILI